MNPFWNSKFHSIVTCDVYNEMFIIKTRPVYDELDIRSET